MCCYEGQHSPTSLELSASLISTSLRSGLPTLMDIALTMSAMLISHLQFISQSAHSQLVLVLGKALLL